jgi:hypothetical protein
VKKGMIFFFGERREQEDMWILMLMILLHRFIVLEWQLKLLGQDLICWLQSHNNEGEVLRY